MKYRIAESKILFDAKNADDVVRFLYRLRANNYEKTKEDFMYGFANRRLLTHHQSIIPTNAEKFVEQLLNIGYLEVVHEKVSKNKWNVFFRISGFLDI